MQGPSATPPARGSPPTAGSGSCEHNAPAGASTPCSWPGPYPRARGHQPDPTPGRPSTGSEPSGIPTNQPACRAGRPHRDPHQPGATASRRPAAPDRRGAPCRLRPVAPTRPESNERSTTKPHPHTATPCPTAVPEGETGREPAHPLTAQTGGDRTAPAGRQGAHSPVQAGAGPARARHRANLAVEWRPNRPAQRPRNNRLLCMPDAARPRAPKAGHPLQQARSARTGPHVKSPRRAGRGPS